MEIFWKPIPGLEGFEASDEGHIRNVKTQKRLNEGFINTGYLTVSCKGYGQFLVHRLVAMAFYPTEDFTKQVNHINGVKTDNRPENLEWMSLGDNVRDFWTNPIFKEAQERRRKQLSALHKGKQVSEETRRKLVESHKKENLSDETRKKMSDSHKGARNLVWINNGKENRMIKPDQLQEHLNQGYVSGRVRRKKEAV